MDWTDELIARLRDLWSQGLSTAEIGRQLSITKNAVVGKAHRLRLPPRPSPIRNNAAEGGAVKPPVKRKPAAARTVKPKAAAVPPKKAEAKPAGKEEDAAKKAVSAQLSAAGQAQILAAAKKAGSENKPSAAPSPGAGTRSDTGAPASTAAREKPETLQKSSAASGPKKGAGIARRFKGETERPARQGPSCQWPFGDPGTPGFHFCGARPLPGKPYCAEHAAVAYVKIRDRRDS